MAEKLKSKPLNLLCVDDDNDFLNYLLSLSQDFNIAIDICNTVKAAQNKLSENQYDAFIVDLKLPDGTGFDLVSEIRKKGEFPIAVISGVYQDEESFRLLKEKYQINYVLTKPIYQHQVTQLLSQISKTVSSKAKSIDEKANELAEYYKKTICDKIDLITNLIEAVKAHPDEFSLTALKNTMHKIAGSAGSYGYLETTKLCRALEYDIDNKLKNSEKIDKEWLLSLNSFLNDVKYSFQINAPKIHLHEPERGANSNFRNSVYVLDYDPQFLKLLEKEKDKFKIDLETELDPYRGKEKLLSPDFNPRVILLSESFPGSSIRAIELIESIQNKPGYLPAIFGIILNKENLDARVNAIRKKVSYIFLKPVSPIVLLETISKSLEAAYLKDIRVLVLDDDKDVCNYIETSLNEIGIRVKTILNPVNLYTELENYSPHVLLLDILLPQYDGLELLKTIRSDPAYKNLIILIITNYKDHKAKEIAYAEQITDIFYKPLDKSLLQTRIFKLATNLMLSVKIFDEEIRLGLNTFQDMIAKLHDCLRKAKSERNTLALFEIDNFANLTLQQSKASANKLMVSISNLINSMPDRESTGYFIGESRLGILFENLNPKVVEERMFKLLQAAQMESEGPLTFTCGLVPISEKFENVQEIVLAAEKGIAEARKKEGSSPLKISLHKDNTEIAEKKRIVLVDPDVDLLKMIKTSLESYDLEVGTFTNGEEALQNIFKHIERHPPALIISERKLPDMEGLEFFNLVKTRFPILIPFYFLTAYSSDQDISEGLKYGVLQYITKPFNMSLLVQRIIKTVYNNGV